MCVEETVILLQLLQFLFQDERLIYIGCVVSFGVTDDLGGILLRFSLDILDQAIE